MSGLLKILTCLIAAQSVLAVNVNPSDFEKATQPDDSLKLVAPRISQPPQIDGDLSDACWNDAVKIGSFWQSGKLEPADDQTLVWVGFDNDNLYVAWACRDRKVVSRKSDRDENDVWRQDCVELFLSPDRNPTNECQFILAASESIYDRRPGPEYGAGGKGWNPQWDGKVKMQPWGYTAEMRVPFAELTDVKKFPITRGTTWSLKLTRQDFGDHRKTRTTSWTPIARNTADPHAAGKLIFEDANLLGSADGEEDPTGWQVRATKVNVSLAASTKQRTSGLYSTAVTVSGKKTAGSSARVWPGPESMHAAPVETTYVFTADVKVESPDETLVAYFVAFHADGVEQINVKHNAGWQTIRTAMTVLPGNRVRVPCLQTTAVRNTAKKTEGGGVIYIDNARLEIVDASAIGLDPDSVCLTGNATDAYRTRNERIAGTYTYTEPMTDDPCFPYYFPEGDGPPQEVGLYRGDIPFDQGRLTDGHHVTAVAWPSFWSGHQGHDVTFDLKADYLITRIIIKATWQGIRMTHVFFKSPDEKIYTRVASEPDLVAFKTAGLHGEEMPRDDQREINGINQRARWIRLQLEARTPGNFSEIEIWGKPIDATDTTPARTAYLQAGGAAPIKNPVSTPEPKRDVSPLFPLPQEMDLSGNDVTLKNGLVIQYEPVDSARAKTTAEVLRDELQLCFGLASSVEPASSTRAASILVGESSESPLTAAALKKYQQTVTAASPGPEGYVLVARDNRIVIAGSDERGAFYGTQALLTLARQSADNQWQVPGAVIRDWPDMPIRIIEGRPIPSKGLVRALARFRVRYYTPKYRNIKKAAEFDAFAERYFVSFIPFIDVNTTVVNADPTLIERPADERWQDMPTDARRNANPGHPRTWEIYFAELDKWLPHFHGDILYIGMDETYQVDKGSRWNVSPESRALNMSAGPLLAYFINKIDKKAKQYGKRLMMHDTPFCRDFKLSYPGDPDPSWRKAIPLLPKDLLFNVWHWNKKWVLEPLGKEHGFDLVYLCTGDRDWRAPKHVDPNEDVMPFEFPGYFAGMNNYMAESSFTASKLLETMWVAWNVDAPRPKDIDVNATIARYTLLWNQLHLDQPIPPGIVAGPDDFIPIDISKAATRSRVDDVPYDGEGWVDMGPNVDLRALPSGQTTMAGVPFNIIDESSNDGKSVVMVHNRMYTDRTLPQSAEIDLNGLQASSLTFLHCLDNAPGWNYLRRRELAGYYFMVYEDGTYAKLELKYGITIGTWDGQKYRWEYAPAGDSMPYAKLAWSGQTTSGMTAKLYMSEWVNPKPNGKLKKIILRATHEPTMMNPMLLAVTATHPRLAAETMSEKLPSADTLISPTPIGEYYDLSGGTDESEMRYVAPDGTVIHGNDIRNQLSDKKAFAYANDWRSYVGQVTIDGHQAARTRDGQLFYTFAKPTSLTGVMVTGRFREQRKKQDFTPMVYNFFVDVSADGGKTWQQTGEVLATSPEEHGPVWLSINRDTVTHVRLRQERGPGTTDYYGFSRVKFYRKE